MYKELQGSSIMLPASVSDVLRSVPAGALKVFIYLCSCNRGQIFAASIPTIACATGIQRRSVISALNSLRNHQLITCISGRGNQPNQYSIPLANRQETAAPPTDDTTSPSQGLRQATPPAATTPAGATTHADAPPGTTPGQATTPSPTPTQATISELVATCYRRINAQELAELKRAYSDDVVLREKLARLNDEGGVVHYMNFAFFPRRIDAVYKDDPELIQLVGRTCISGVR